MMYYDMLVGHEIGHALYIHHQKELDEDKR